MPLWGWGEEEEEEERSGQGLAWLEVGHQRVLEESSVPADENSPGM